MMRVNDVIEISAAGNSDSAVIIASTWILNDQVSPPLLEGVTVIAAMPGAATAVAAGSMQSSSIPATHRRFMTASPW
jgi:hypothetical protein